NPDTRDTAGTSPLHMAVSLGQASLVQALLDAGAEPTVCDQRQRTPLHTAVEAGHTDVVRALVKIGGDALMAATDAAGCTVAHLAC
ncbi:uncharacterized protein MONBRDRAFT_3288, partial [Monosiga brevicollis MX1]